MAKCPVLVKRKDGKLRNCNRDAAVLYKVTYSALFPYREKEGKYFDLFGICSCHAAEYAVPKAWHDSGGWQGRDTRTVNGIRGTVTSVESTAPPTTRDLEGMYREDERRKLAAGCKSSIKRMMGQRNTSKLTDDDWRAIFQECIEEFTVEQVMRS